MLHLGDTAMAERLEPLVARAFSMTASTSMSGILMGSLDTARRALVQGGAQIGEAVAAAAEIRARLRQDPRFRVISDDFAAFPDIVETDALRIPIDVSALGQSGHWVRARLIDGHGTYTEMSTATSVVLVIGALRTVDVDRFMRDLGAVADEAAALPATDAVAFPALPEAGELRMRPREAFFGDSETRVCGRGCGPCLGGYARRLPARDPEPTARRRDYRRDCRILACRRSLSHGLRARRGRRRRRDLPRGARWGVGPQPTRYYRTDPVRAELLARNGSVLHYGVGSVGDDPTPRRPDDPTTRRRGAWATDLPPRRAARGPRGDG